MELTRNKRNAQATKWKVPECPSKIKNETSDPLIPKPLST